MESLIKIPSPPQTPPSTEILILKYLGRGWVLGGGMGLGYGDAQARHVVPELRRGGGGETFYAVPFLYEAVLGVSFSIFRMVIGTRKPQIIA